MNAGERPSIVFFSDAAYAGGAERYLYLLAAGLDRKRFRTAAVLCNMTPDHQLSQMISSSGIETRHVEWKRTLSPGGMRALSLALKGLSVDIFHMNLPGPFDSRFSLAAPVARLAGARAIVSTEHLPMFPSFTKARLLKGISTRYIDTVITVSEDNRKHLVTRHRVPGRKIRTIYNGVPEPADSRKEDLFADFGEQPASLRLLIAGSIEERKGHAVLIDAMKLLPGDVVLTVAGEGPGREELERLIEGHDMKDRVRFAGFREDIIPLMRGADLLVVPSFVEATPYVIMEAFSVGLPVIASGIFGMPELVTQGSTGRLVRPGDSDALASALSEYREDRGVLARESITCRDEFAKRFTLERCIRETTGVYDELLDRERRDRE